MKVSFQHEELINAQRARVELSKQERKAEVFAGCKAALEEVTESLSAPAAQKYSDEGRQRLIAALEMAADELRKI